MAPLPFRALALAGLLAAAAPVAASAAEAGPPPYGENLTTEEAKTVLAKAEAEAKRLGAQVGIAVVDTQGNLLVFERMAGANANTEVRAPLKAKAAAIWRRPTLIWDTSGPGGAVSRPNGGEMIIKGGKVVGGVGINSTEQFGVSRERLARGAALARACRPDPAAEGRAWRRCLHHRAQRRGDHRRADGHVSSGLGAAGATDRGAHPAGVGGRAPGLQAAPPKPTSKRSTATSRRRGAAASWANFALRAERNVEFHYLVIPPR